MVLLWVHLVFRIESELADHNETNPLFDQSSRTDQVLEMLDNDELIKSMWPIVKEYSKNMPFSHSGTLILPACMLNSRFKSEHSNCGFHQLKC